jgi:hypothetical protein
MVVPAPNRALATHVAAPPAPHVGSGAAPYAGRDTAARDRRTPGAMRSPSSSAFVYLPNEMRITPA